MNNKNKKRNYSGQVIPAKAGIRTEEMENTILDSRFRGNDSE